MALCWGMCPLSVAVDRGKCFLISVGVSPGMVASSSLRWRAPRSVADGGEHMHWWMYLAYSAADDVATTLAAMVKVGSVVGSLETAGGPVAWALEP